nr:hypothetical protein [Tanacetum cinerariifolium]
MQWFLEDQTGWKLRRRKWTGTTERLIKDLESVYDKENLIVVPDVDVHLFGISIDVPFDNIGITNIVPNDVLKGEDMDVINADGFNSDLGDNDKISNYMRRRLAELSREMKVTASQVIEDVIRQLSFEETRLDEEAGFGDVARSGVESFRLSHDESFGVDDLDLNLNEPMDQNVSQIETQFELPVSEELDVGRTQEPIVAEVKA